MSNYGRDGLTDLEYLYDTPQLVAHIEKEARDLWPMTKGRDVRYDASAALELLFRQRPDLYTRYTTLVHRDTGRDTPAPAPVAPARPTESGAGTSLHGLAETYVGKGLTYADGLELAIRDRPDWYRAHGHSVVRKVVR